MLRLLLLVLLASVAIGQSSEARLVVLGVDGLDHQRVVRMMAAGELPHLKALADEGVFAPLATTNPAQSPVSWAAMTTGLNPGRTGIDGFLVRRFDGPDVELAISLVDRAVDRSGLASRSRRRLLLAALLLASVLGAAFGWVKARRAVRVVASLGAAFFAAAIWVSETALPDGLPYPINQRQGRTWWETLDERGVRTATMLAPCSFPAASLEHGHLLCGLGVPDVRGTMGTWSVMRDDVTRSSSTETGGIVVPLIYREPGDPDGGRFEPVAIAGPPNIVRDDGTDAVCWLALTLGRKSGVVYVTDGIHSEQLVEGQWSAPFPFLFKMSSWVRARGNARFKLLSTVDVVKVYVEPVSLEPGELPPGVRISHPDSWTMELKHEIGAFETVGWACATNPLKDGVIDEDTFLEDALRVWDEQRRLALREIGRREARVVSAFLTVPDRVQHMFSRYDWSDRDARGEPSTERARRAIADIYRRVDELVGEIRREHTRPGDALIIVSDHGFAPWKRAVNLNRLLVERGWLTLRERTGRRSLEDLRQGGTLAHVDWSRTRAYSIGLGKIYLNRAGREPQGIVADSEADALRAEIRAALLELRDGDLPVVATATPGVELYDGDAIRGGAADLYVGFHRGYRVSWQTCLGGADEAVLSDNVSAWSGDHCGVDPAAVPGVLLSDLRLDTDGARVLDVAPTVLAWCGVAAEGLGARDGRSLLRAD